VIHSTGERGRDSPLGSRVKVEPSAASLVLDGVRKSYRGRVVLDVPRLEAPARRSLVLIGPSGCGKSTLLRLVVGLTAPDAGAVRMGGVPMERSSRRGLRLRMGYVIQDGGLFPHLTAAANAAIVARDLGWERERIERRVVELAELTRFPRELLDHFPRQLSGGQQQRVGLMRALMLDPEVLLLDEPLAALDPMIRAELQDELKALFARLEKTVLFVTHDLAEAAFLGDAIAIMRGGRVLQVGPLAELAERPADPFVTEFMRAQRGRA